MTKLILSTSNIMAAGPPLIRGHNLEKSNAELTNAIRSNIRIAQEAALAAAAAAAATPIAKNATSSQNHDNRHEQASNADTRKATPAFPGASTSTQLPPLQAWTVHDPKTDTLSIPAHSFAHSGLQEDRNNYDITAKLFYLPSASPSQSTSSSASSSTSISTLRGAHAREAIDLVLHELHVPSIDLLIVSFPGVAFDEEDEDDDEDDVDEEEQVEAEGKRAVNKEKLNTGTENESKIGDGAGGGDRGELAEEVDETTTHLKTWHILESLQSKVISSCGEITERNEQHPPECQVAQQSQPRPSSPLIHKLGLAEFGTARLARFLPGTTVKPAVDQINIRDCCVVPKGLIMFAREHGIELLTHSDCTNILPGGTLRELLGEAIPSLKSTARAGCSSTGGTDWKGNRSEHDVEHISDEIDEDNKSENLLKGEIEPQWVIKYTAVVKDRGVIENKGYFAVAMLKDGK